MEAMRQTWTDDRMDDLAAQVETGFAQARVDLGSTREEQICGGLAAALIAVLGTVVAAIL